MPGKLAVDAMARLDGDIMLLGVGGKIGPSLARMAYRASVAAGVNRRIIAVSRFLGNCQPIDLECWGIETIRGDLFDDTTVKSLPDIPNIIYLVGAKFGTSSNGSLTWATNVYLSSVVARRFSQSRLAVFSTGNVYGLSPVDQHGSKESDLLSPVGEYAYSAVARERIFEYYSYQLETPLSLLRLNYAVEMRYGVLLDIALDVANECPIDLSMGYVNVIWQGDANQITLAALADATHPPDVINIGGPEILSVRSIAETFGDLLGKEVKFTGTEANDALISNVAKSCKRYGLPTHSVGTLIPWVASWVRDGHAILGKSTCFESRDGRF